MPPSGAPPMSMTTRQPAFTFDGTAYTAPVTLGDGNWNIRMVAVAADGTEFTQRVVLLKK